MGRRGQRYRVSCHICSKKHEVGLEISRLEFYQPPGADTIILFVCNAECERKMYDGARFLNFFMGNEPVAYECDTVVRMDKLIEYGAITVEDGKIVYVKKSGGVAPE